MVDVILANPRNPVNHDLWLTGRFSTSVNHPLFLSLQSLKSEISCLIYCRAPPMQHHLPAMLQAPSARRESESSQAMIVVAYH